MSNNQPRYIVCAAIRNSGRIICGARHFDSIMRRQLEIMGIERNSFQCWQQGFIDNNSQFYTREEALKLALEMGQIRRTGSNNSLNPHKVKGQAPSRNPATWDKTLGASYGARTTVLFKKRLAFSGQMV